MNKYKELRMQTETDQSAALTQLQLSQIFEAEGYPVTQSVISKLETSTDPVPTQSLSVLEAYSKHFNVTTDYLLGIRETKQIDENIAMISKVTGLDECSIISLKQLRAGNAMDDFFNTLNFTIGNDTSLFISLIEAIRLYLDGNFDTPMHFENNTFVPMDDGFSTSPITASNERCVLIGSYDDKLCKGNGGYRTMSIPISILKEAYAIQSIQKILNELKNKWSD